MNRIMLAVSLALASLVVTSAFAQGPGEDRAVPTKPATAQEKAAAKAARKAEGTAARKAGAAREDKEVLGKAKAATKEQRKEAAKARKAAATAAVKKGEISSGEK